MLCEGSQNQTSQKVTATFANGQATKTVDCNKRHSGVKRSKSAQKQKLVTFETEATSPKLQKLSLKRLYHTLSSPPLMKKESSKRDHDLISSVIAHSDQSALVNSSEKQSISTIHGKVQNSISLIDQEVLSSQVAHNSYHATNTDIVTVEVHPSHQLTPAESLQEDSPNSNGKSFAEDLDDHANFSMDATLSDSVSLSQLLSFDSKDQNVCNPESFEHQSGYSWAPQDSSLATPESPTGDNVSDIPSSGSSANSDSNPDVSKQNLAPEAFIAEVQNRHLVNSGDNSKTIAELVSDISLPVASNNAKSVPQFEKLQMTLSDDFGQSPEECSAASNDGSAFANVPLPNAQTPKSNDSFDNLILSPPEIFNDKQGIDTLDRDRDILASKIVTDIKMSSKTPSARTMERSKTEIHEICPKFVSGIAVSGSFAQDLYRANNDLGESFQKKRDKLSPISPIEDSKRKFESEIGRLIVRDRQMKLEMEQMKAERQKRGTDSSIFPELDKSRLKGEGSFVDVLEFKKSPVKSCEYEKKKTDCDDLLKCVREERKTSSAPPFSYSRYVRMENKPSVKELLSRFEGNKEEEPGSSPKPYSDNLIPLQKQSSCVFSNVQVINHNFPLTYSKSVGANCNIDQSARDNHSKENIFQTECVIRFPHPKSTNFLSQACSKSDSKSTFGDSGTNSSWIGDQTIRSSPKKSIFSSSDNLFVSLSKPDLSSLPNSVGKKASVDLPPLCESIVSDNLSRSLPCANESTTDSCYTDNGNQFSSFKDTFNRANKALKMKNEFLRRGIPQLDEGDRTTEKIETNRFSRSPTECRKRQPPTRQRPKSVPPPTCRLSFSTIKEHEVNLARSQSKQTSFPQSVPKTSSVGLTNGNSSQPYGLPKRVKERAAIFERSLSFSGSVERTPSCNYSHKAQADSSTR